MEVSQSFYSGQFIAEDTYVEVERLGGGLFRALSSIVSEDPNKLGEFPGTSRQSDDSDRTVYIGQDIFKESGKWFVSLSKVNI